MKRRVFVLFLCLYLIVGAVAIRLSVHVTGNDADSTEPLEDIDRMDIVASNTQVWDSYYYFMIEENFNAWSNPESLVGSTAFFNIDYISNFVFAPDDENLTAIDTGNPESCAELSEEDIIALGGKDFKVVITDYKFILHDEENGIGDLWYKLEAAEGYELPETIENNPYVLFAVMTEDYPALLTTPIYGMFAGETAEVQPNTNAASKTEVINAADSPTFFPIEYFFVEAFGIDFYDLGDVSSWENIADSENHYVSTNFVNVIPSDVSRAYDALMASESVNAFYTVFNAVPDAVLEKFTEAHKENIVAHVEQMTVAESVVYEATATVGGQEIDVSVKGKIPPDAVELTVSEVSDQEVMDGGFGIESAEDIIAALDIKLVNKSDGTEWQPEEGFPVELSIDMASLGYEDGSVVRFHHKHGDRIDKYDVFVVLDGKLTFYTDSFSFYIVSELGVTNANLQSDKLNNTNKNDPYEIAVGDRKVFYYNASTSNNGGVNNTQNGNNSNTVGTWSVTDPSGAIHYTVYSQSNVGNGGMVVRWIEVRALRETTEPITLTYTNTRNTETHYLSVVSPKATNTNNEYQNNGRRLYIKDLVNTTGTITAALVDTNGNDISETGLAGASFSWTRDDGLFIVPQAYGEGYKSVDIARDHGGLVEARMKDDKSGYAPVTYKLTVTLSDGTVLKEGYTVYYQSEIINASFEFPVAPSGTYTFFPNGYPELYWKTTAPGTSGNITKDVEYGSVVGGDQASFGIDAASDGNQFAELNAEEVGALYQDIITVPSSIDNKEYIEWSFSHAARSQLGSTNSMYIIFGPTEQAQKLLSQDDLIPLGQAAKDAAEDLSTAAENEFYEGTRSVKVEYTRNGGTATYEVWYHSVTTSQPGDWLDLSGSYEVPEGQHRTRVFFVTDTADVNRNKNYGNLIDISQAGQYKDYLIEYYEETYVDGELQLKYYGLKTEKETAIIYSSAKIQNFDYFEKEQNDYLHKILINGKTYPYDIRYSGTPSLYIENYPGAATDAKKPTIHTYEQDSNHNDILNNNNYEDYDIVMQVYFRDTVIAVEKNLVLPSKEYDANGKLVTDGMTEEQKLTLLEKLNAKGGYKTDFILTSDNTKFVSENGQTVITSRDPAGNYKAFIALGNNPPLDANYYVEEVRPSDPEGLVLSKVEFSIYRYSMGATIEDEAVLVSYEKIDIDDLSEKLITSGIYFGDVVLKNGETVSVKIADVTVTNTYEEKKTKIYYQAIGNGKIKKTDSKDFEDMPVEELAYYSGVSKGVEVHKGEGAHFVGWFTHPSCEEQYKVTDIHGVVDSNGTFKPNANIINADEVYFYAKFDTTSIEIEREEADPYQTFVYKVEQLEGGSNVVKTIYVTLKCDENGNGEVVISELGAGTYRVTEITSWSWRHGYNDTAYIKTGTHTIPPDSSRPNPLVFTFDKPVDDDYWLNAYSDPLKNVGEGAG